MIERMVSHLAGHGITEVVLSMGFLPGAFAEGYPDGTCVGIPLHYAVEPEPLDTAGAIAFAATHAGIDADSHDSFLVQNGDVLTNLDVDALVAAHLTVGAEGTIALTAVDDPSRYGVVPTDSSGKVLGFVEKPAPGQAPTNLVNAGTYVLEPSVLGRITAGVRVSVERQVFPAMAADGTLYAHLSEASWIDAGTPATYLQANLETLADPSGSVVDKSATIASDAVVQRSVVLAGASIGENAVVKDSIIGPGAIVGASAHVTAHGVLGAGAVVADG
jgi:mannose-1-phosphate guanylyltransferase